MCDFFSIPGAFDLQAKYSKTWLDKMNPPKINIESSRRNSTVGCRFRFDRTKEGKIQKIEFVMIKWLRA